MGKASVDTLRGLGPKSRDMLARVGVDSAAELHVSDPFALGDEWGPAKVIHVQAPKLGLRELHGADALEAGSTGSTSGGGVGTGAPTLP